MPPRRSLCSSSTHELCFTKSLCSKLTNNVVEHEHELLLGNGVSCDRVTGNVISLYLRYSGFKGSIESNSSLFQLRHLRFLDLSYVDFKGSLIPPAFGNFKNLTHLHFVGSNFRGVVPFEISRLSKLVSFRIFAMSQYSVVIEEATFKAIARNLTDLRDLVFDGVDMSRVSVISLSNFSSSLSSLNLRYCRLHGNFHDNAFDRFENLQVLDLSGNVLSGRIPQSALHSRSLSVLNLSFNNFTGEIPYTNSSSITILDLTKNSLDSNIPNWVFKLPILMRLALNDNLLTGQIYDFHSKYLYVLSLRNNKLQGLIPKSMSQHVMLSNFDLSSNNFNGSFDLDQLSKLKYLTLLSFSFNNVSLSFNTSTKYDFHNLESVGLSNCNIREFPHFLRQAKSLLNIEISHNHLHGNVPKWFVQLGNNSLNYVNISHNFLTHIDPLHWNNLQLLDLSSNFFSVPIPISSSMSSLRIALLSKNQFSGEVPISFCATFSLEVLDLSYNNLSGTIPRCITNTSTVLSVLDLRRNNLRGVFPMTFSDENSLRTLNYNWNQLEGSLDRSLLNCKKLEVLDIGGNRIRGPFPQWLESLPELQVLILRENEFYGSIGNPIDLRFSFRKLRILDLSNNEFTGALPGKYFENLAGMMNAHTNDLKYVGEGYYRDSVTVTMKGFSFQLEKILTIFTAIDLSRNGFDGEIPSSIGKLKSLKGLNLSHNNFFSQIPLSLGNLSNLEWLDLSSNALYGAIPDKLAEDLTQLSFLNVSVNRLTGLIPRGKQFNTFENGSYIENLGLCGSPLSRTCIDGQTQQVSPTSSKNEEEFGFDWKIVMLMGYGCGMVFGVSMGYVVLVEIVVDRILDNVRGIHRRKQRIPENNARVKRVRRRN